jgi:hypothetical protein
VASYRFAPAAASRTPRIHLDVVFPALRAVASMSAASDSDTRQYNRPAREVPFGSGGLPRFFFLLILKINVPTLNHLTSRHL